MIEMRRGSIALIDALGFKGLWQRYSPGIIIQKLNRMRNSVLRLAQHGEKHVGHGRTHIVRFLSDSVVIGCHCGNGTEYSQQELDIDTAGSVAILTNSLIRSSLKEEPFLLFRGCITTGEFVLDGNFLVGEAVDEAAAAMNKADGAFVWVTPTVLSLLESFELDKDSIFLRYPVPLKDGRLFETSVVNPFCYVPDLYRVPQLEKMIKSFDRSGLDVQIKKQNTESFLLTALKVTSSLSRAKVANHMHSTDLSLENTSYEWEE